MNFSTNPHIRYIVEGMATFFFSLLFLPIILHLSETLLHIMQNIYKIGLWLWRKSRRSPVDRRVPRETFRHMTRTELGRLLLKEPDKSVKTWKSDYLKAVGLWTVTFAAVLCVLISYNIAPDVIFALMILLCMVPAYFGLSYFGRGQKRRRGKKLESRAIKIFTKLKPSEWDVVPNHILDAFSVIDLLVRLHTNELCVIEIKRWQSWSGFLLVKRALGQVQGQRRAIKASYAVVWLPHARTASAEYHGGVFVVGGNTKYLLGKLLGIIRTYTVVEFPTRPRDLILQYIKMKNFRWNRTTLRWEGVCSERDLLELKRQVMLEGGTVRSEESASLRDRGMSQKNAA